MVSGEWSFFFKHIFFIPIFLKETTLSGQALTAQNAVDCIVQVLPVCPSNLKSYLLHTGPTKDFDNDRLVRYWKLNH